MRKLIDWQKRQQRKNTLTLKFCQRHRESKSKIFTNNKLEVLLIKLKI